MLQDLRFAGRTLARTPGFTAIAVVVLAIGIGANSAIFSLANGLIFEPLPFEDAERLTVFWDENPGEGRFYNEVAPAHVAALERARSFEGVAAYDGADVTLTGAGLPERLSGFVISHDFLPLLRVSPVLGRGFTPEDDRAGAAPVALLGHGFWQRNFGGSGDVLGRTVVLDGTPTTIVGVLPADFAWERPGDVYVPLALPDSLWQSRSFHWLRVVGRLAPGASLADARAEATTISAVLEREYPGTGEGWRISVWPAAEGLFQGPVRPTMFALLASVAFVLLIACADLANLLLARASGRRREIAVRAALGARRRRLVRQLLTESLLLAGLGGALGLVFGVWMLEAIRARMAVVQVEAPRLFTLGLDGEALAYTAAVTIATGLLFGIVPALRGTRVDLSSELKEGSAGGGRRHRLRGALIVAEVALALMLVAGAGLMIRSFVGQQSANPGIDSGRLLTFWVSLPSTRYATGIEMAAYQDRMLDGLSALPGVDAAAGANTIPLSGEGLNRDFGIDRPPAGDEPAPFANLRLVSPDYFRVLGLQLRSGRVIDEGDREGAPLVAVISSTLAARHFPGEDPIGRSVVIEGGDAQRTIVGVVSDLRDWRTGNSSDAYIFVPFQQFRSDRMGFMVRAAGDPAALTQAVRAAAFEVDPEVPIYDVRTMVELEREALFGQRFGTTMMSALGLVALLLAGFGIYGVVSYAVGERTREIGIRVALGARRSDLLREVIGQSMRPVAIGMVIGLAGAALFGRGLRPVLFDVGGIDAVTFASVALLLAATALVASWLPAHRALRVDPVRALNSE